MIIINSRIMMTRYRYCHHKIIIADLEAATVDLDSRIMVIEENGNQTITELEAKVETLEGTAADHETRISSTESDVTGR